jgi:hypothetical protein
VVSCYDFDGRAQSHREAIFFCGVFPELFLNANILIIDLRIGSRIRGRARAYRAHLYLYKEFTKSLLVYIAHWQSLHRNTIGVVQRVFPLFFVNPKSWACG